MKSTIKLFKSVEVRSHLIKGNITYSEIIQETIKNGFIFTPDIMSQYSLDELRNISKLVNKEYGKDFKELNNSLHKSFHKVKNASLGQLVIEQIFHYITTYGAERAGVYDEDYIYIPNEILKQPDSDEPLKLAVIKGMTVTELYVELLELLGSGIALSNDSIKCAIDIAKNVNIVFSDIESIKNKEVKTALYDFYDIAPQNPVEFLRFVVYKSTQKTLIIKNQGLINDIKSKSNYDIDEYFQYYEDNVGLDKLATIFYRYKPIFLAFKTNKKLNTKINKIRKLAVANHKPMPEDLLNTITSRLKHNDIPKTQDFIDALENANVFRKVRLAYTLQYRMSDADCILYKVRNGKSYVKDFSFDNKKGASIIYKLIVDSIVQDISSKIDGKKIYLPENVKYTLPATEKQFTGNIPSGSTVEIDEDMVIGVHWENLENYRVDLDLSLLSNTGKIGWNASYRDNRNGIYFTGDMTDAQLPNGASELFHIDKEARGNWNLMLNFFNKYTTNEVCPFKLFIGKEKRSNIDRNYVINPANIVASANCILSEKQINIGNIIADGESIKFVFSQYSDSGSNIAINSKYTEKARKAIEYSSNETLYLNDVLEKAGAVFTEDKNEADIDLSIESIDKTTIINLLTK